MMRRQIATLLAVLAVMTDGAAAAPAPDTTLAANEASSESEVEFWRSAQRIDTPAAYRAYLDAFPNGVFASLARMKAAGSAGATAPATSAAPAPAGVPNAARPAANLRYFSEALADSGAIELRLGDRLIGPGWLTVGSIGAKKQLIIPAGEWVLLAASDTKSTQPPMIAVAPRPVRVGMTTVVFGKFSGDQLATLLRVTTNIQVAKVGAWSDLEGCDPPAGAIVLEHARTPGTFRDECKALRVEDSPLQAEFTTAEEAKRNLGRLGARVGGAGLVTSLSFAEQKRGYLGITRIDWPATVLGASADKASAWRGAALEGSAERQAYLKRLGEWARAYRELASQGYQQAFDGTDLVPNAPSRAIAELAPIGGFDPSGLAAAR